MSAEVWTIIGTGIALALLISGLFAWLKSDIAKLQDGMSGLRERIARIDGKMDLLMKCA